MKAFVIPANSSERVREIKFDRDESWRYVLTRYKEPGKHPWFLTEIAFLTKENAPRDYLLKKFPCQRIPEKSLPRFRLH
jgi:Uma2 family endonuclease